MSRRARRLRPSRRWTLRACVALAAAALTGLGLAGTYSYGRAYNEHRGFAALVQLPRAGTGRLLSIHFYSDALHRQADYMVYLPPGYIPARRYPVYYLLHGMPGQPRVFVTIANLDVRLDNQLSLGHLRPMILVYPDGRIGADTFSDSEWANTPSGHFESYVLEVVRNVDARFSTIRRRQDRLIAGFSSGAYGAMNIALHHLALFGNVQAWSGYYLQTHSGVFAHSGRAMLASNSPLDYVYGVRRALAADPLDAYLFTGRDDGSRPQQAPMARALRALGARVRTAVYPGGHDWSVWYPRLNQMLILASRAVSGAIPSAQLTVRERTRTAPEHPHRTHGMRRHHRIRVASRPPAAGRNRPTGKLALVGSLLLALVSAALINLGFVLQPRGLQKSPVRGVADALRNRTWLTGQALGWVGFGAQIVAVALAPLTLVQAFAAGSFALSTPVAARLLGYRIKRRQIAAVTVIAASLCTLPIGVAGRPDVLESGTLIGATLGLTVVAAVLAGRRRPGLSTAAGGAFYGAADAAIKACAIDLHAHGAEALLSGWTVLACLCTLAGFLSFQAALRDGEAINVITLMNAFTTLVAMALGVSAFAESVGTTPVAGVVHVCALALVLAVVRPLVAGQSGPDHPGTDRASGHGEPRNGRGQRRPPGWLRHPLVRAGLRAGQATAGTVALLIAVLVGTGLLYGLRGLGALDLGPRIPDALPLLQLAGFDGQPVLRVAVAWLAAGIVLGLPVCRVAPLRRFAVAAMAAAPLVLFASDASFALARNLRLTDVLVHRAPPLGPWFEVLLLAVGCALPATLDRLTIPAPLGRRSWRSEGGEESGVVTRQEQHAT